MYEIRRQIEEGVARGGARRKGRGLRQRLSPAEARATKDWPPHVTSTYQKGFAVSSVRQRSLCSNTKKNYIQSQLQN